MNVREVGRLPNLLPPDDDHPYRTGAWQPQFVEYDADELDVIEGVIPPELSGVYLRNTENPVMPSIGRYHPFDGDGMVHSIRFGGGRASYRNRFVRTAGLAVELAAGEPQWAGIIESPTKSKRDGWGARGRMKDASSTDVVVHAGRAMTTFYQCGDAYQLDPITLEQHGAANFDGKFPKGGISAHPKLDPATGELLYFGYGTEAPYCWYGVLDAQGRHVHHTPVPLPGPRLPHDIAFTEHYAILNDLPLFWDPELLAKGVYRPRWRPDLPTRLAVIPRRGGAADIRWFEAAPTYVLHWMLRKLVDVNAMGARPHRWRLDLRTGKCSEERLFNDVSEFPSIHYAKPGRKHRYVWSMTAPTGRFVFDGILRLDLQTGATQTFKYPDGVYASESPMAPRPGSAREDDGWIVTFVSDVANDRSECHIFDASAIHDGPIARIALPARISSGTHACWAPL